MAAMTTLHLSQDPDADALLSQDPLALLLGMLLDQRMLTGCTSSATYRHRLTGVARPKP